MRRFSLPLYLGYLAAGLLLAGCATERPLPTWEPPLAKTQFQHVRTTAYFDGEADHLRYTNHNALGSTLRCGHVTSAAADWSRWPAGTMFRILQTGRTYVVDDYGWALAGRNTIDLYEPTRSQMDNWGVRHVDIQILQWGDPRESYYTLLPRAKYRHVDRMLHELRPELSEPPREMQITAAPEPPVQNPVGYERGTPVNEYSPAGNQTTARGYQPGPVLTPFLSSAQ